MSHGDATPTWPDVPRICFGPGEPAELNACVEWALSGTDGIRGYVEGYRRAAVRLFAAAAESHESPDCLIWPMAFLWRHHVELAMKNIVATGRVLNGEPWGFPEHHRLFDLWKEVRPYLEDVAPGALELDNVEAGIVEFQTIDPAADGFRYPIARGFEQRSLPTAPAYVNLKVLHEAMEAVANFLSAGQMELQVRLDYATEAESSR